MHTARLETVCASVLVATTRRHSQEVPPNEQVWAGLQWSPPDVTSRGSPGLITLEEGMLHDLCWGGTLAYDLCHDTFDVTYPPTIWQMETDTYENTTFSQLRLRALKIP